MSCENRIIHTVRRGDTLYLLARFYHTTAYDILAQNPDIDPYNLQIGQPVAVCPGADFEGGDADNGTMDGGGITEQGCALIGDMREAWIQHVYWTRMFLISTAERLKDQPEVTKQLLLNPAVIADIFGRYYPAGVADGIQKLLTEHLETGGKIITALRDGNSAEVAEQQRLWYLNADEIADALSAINPYYKQGEVQKMLYEHLDLTTQEAVMRVKRNYAADIQAFDKVEQAALGMADYFSLGLISQFPKKFGAAVSPAPM